MADSVSGTPQRSTRGGHRPNAGRKKGGRWPSVVHDKKTGKFIRVTEAMAKAKLGKDEEIIEVWEKDPSVQAFADLLNRALDKPKEQEREIKMTGSDNIIAKLHAARARMAKRYDG